MGIGISTGVYHSLKEPKSSDEIGAKLELGAFRVNVYACRLEAGDFLGRHFHMFIGLGIPHRKCELMNGILDRD
jgi:hypothetical protein